MGKVMRHTLGASLNIRHNLSSSKGPKPLQLKLLTTYIPKTSAFTLAFSTSQRLRTTRAIGKILTSRLSLSKHLAHNLGNLLLLGKIGVFHNRRNASSRLLLLISKHLILCIYLVFRILA